MLGNLSCASAVQAEKSQPIDNESYSSTTKKKKRYCFFPFRSCERIKLFADDTEMSKTPTWHGELMYLLCDIDVKMNICKRCSAVRSWRRCSNLDASDRSTQIPHKSPLGKEPWCESD